MTLNSKIKHLGRDFIWFAIVGIIATATQYTVLILLVELLHIKPVAASSTGFMCGAIVNYILNKRLTFKSDKAHHKAIAQFLCILAIGFSLNAFFMYLGTHYTSFPYIFVQVFATLLVLFWNFVAHRHWTFCGP